MPSTNHIFTVAGGGVNGSNALVNDSNPFYVDIGKFAVYETLILEDVAPALLSLEGNVVTDLTINISNAQMLYGVTSTFTIALWHEGDSSYSDGHVHTFSQAGSPETIALGGTWGKTWSVNDVNNIKVKFYDPVEVGIGTIALSGTYVFLTVTSIPVTATAIKLSSGKLVLSGKVTI